MIIDGTVKAFSGPKAQPKAKSPYLTPVDTG